ncbi:hypothetical protein [Streptomyces sp. NPDC049879]|uniref:hypothetical protein n=1 Tax=Streptomyces sp. NPDC049879 TaxID=3365598 RepID=UPI0037B7C858
MTEHPFNQIIPAPAELPPGIHVRVLTERDLFTGARLNAVVVWTDDLYAMCPDCGTPTARDTTDACPVTLAGTSGPGRELRDLGQRHPCGAWPYVYYQEVHPADGRHLTSGDVLRAAADLAAQRPAASPAAPGPAAHDGQNRR